MNDRIIQTDIDEVFDGAGNVIASEVVERDVTAQVVEWALHQRVRDGIANSEARTDKQRIAALEAQVEALTRLVVGRDLLG